MKNKDEIKISVVIPLYNKDKSIKRTIETVLNQTYKNFELIIVNDGSTDLSLEIVRLIYDKRIRIIDKSNGGVSSARNAGIKASSNEYIAFLDADDLWEETYLEEICKLIEKCPDAGLLGTSYRLADKQNKIIEVFNSLPGSFNGYITNYFKIALKNMLYHSSASTYKKNVFNNLGLFDEALSRGEDIDMWIRLALFEKIAFFNKPLATYSLGAENRATERIDDWNKYLIWNLSRYSEFEKRNKDFKLFIDNYRLLYIRNCLSGSKNEVKGINTILNAIDLKNFPLFWTIMKFLPDNLRILMYKYRKWIYKVFQKVYLKKATI
jgi:glycosyltransferase involved in cell wall biosynthesis